MPAPTAPIEWIVKTALMDETIPTDELVTRMQKHQLTSHHLLSYIDDDTFWPIYVPDSSLKIAPQDQKYIIDFKNPGKKQALNALRQQARDAVYARFYTGHKFNEWMI